MPLLSFLRGLSGRLCVCILLSSTGALGATALLTDTKDDGKQGLVNQTTALPKSKHTENRPVSSSSASTGVGGSVVQISGPWQRTYDLPAGRVVEISVHLDRPSTLPPNGRIAVGWEREGEAALDIASASKRPDGIGQPTAGWRKVLHALDSDVYLIYRAPVAGRYTLSLKPITDEEPVGATARWREKGDVPQLFALPAHTPWPAGMVAPCSVSVRPLAIGDPAEQERLRTTVECKPDGSPEMAQVVPMNFSDEVRPWEITGTSDENEYFDNGKVGQAGDSWYRIDYQGKEPRLLTAQLSMPMQMVAARVRCYTLDSHATSANTGKPDAVATNQSAWKVGDPLLPVVEYQEGQEENERAHQQEEPYRTSITRLLKPGNTYFLRVEANAPGYQLQCRVVKPAPYTDPRLAIRQGVYAQIGQVDAWLTNRPRGASIERRIRDSGNLLGTQCMSCHTQSGVWGPAVPFTQGYRPENVQNYWHLLDVMYECLRPTNTIKDAANNTSLAPLDFGDGPAGTRAAGFNIVHAERFRPPTKLHSKQLLRTANYVLASGDPGGINAAGPGSNVGQVVVYLMSSEILKAAWEQTGDPKYFRALEERLHKALAVEPKYTDDVALRLDLLGRVMPLKDYPALAGRAAAQERALKLPDKSDPKAEKQFLFDAAKQTTEDEVRLRAIQNPDGSWGFNPGVSSDSGKTWKASDNSPDPSPTALGITGLTSLGYGKDDPTIARGVTALLAMQKPAGRWNKAAQTGFVTTAYALHALARLYPATSTPVRRADFASKPNETLLMTLHRAQQLALAADPECTDLLLCLTHHDSPLVRYWAQVGLGAVHSDVGVPAVIAALADHAKPVREAATWALRQTLLDDKGWSLLPAAFQKGNDDTRAQIALALNMRADGVLPHAHLDWERLTALLDLGMNRDPNPAVRAWSARASWQWWVWNPPVRAALNNAWVTLLTRPEPNALVENCDRYAAQALFIANGHKANGSKDQQYSELEGLFKALLAQLESGSDTETRDRLTDRLVGIGATFYTLAGGDGGPGQMGYSTTGAGELMGKAALAYMSRAEKRGDLTALRIGLQGSANVPYQQLTDYLVNYSLRGPEALRPLASSAISDPRSVSLAAVPELVEPQLAQVMRGAMEPPRREQVSEPILSVWSRVNWVIPKTTEQQRSFFDLIIPRLDHYTTPAEMAAITDPARRTDMERTTEADHYLALRLGQVLQQNPDLHQEIVLTRYFPSQFRNPLQELYWLPNVEWILNYNSDKSPAPGAKPVLFQQPSQAQPQPDPILTVKDRALQLYLDQLKPTADPATRAIAIRMSNQTAFRTNPEVIRALAALQATETSPELQTIITNVLKQSNEHFLPDLMDALKKEKHPSITFDAKGEPTLSKAQTEDIVYFRDFVLPELSRQKRSDQMACMGCHGVPGRVPSMQLHPPDKYGYMPVTDLLSNYRTLQQRIAVTDLEKSKLLRKPLNIQNGKEDGHQGGRRYSPTDEGYLVLKHWAEAQPEVQKTQNLTPKEKSD